MIFDVLTLFPESIDRFLNESIIGRARRNGIITVNTINIRDFSLDKHRKVDDYPYGGGAGMVMTPQPLYDAWEYVVKQSPIKAKTIYMSPQGRVLTQDLVQELKNEERLIIICGHYEGIDERVLEEVVDEEISIGDYVLTGGELPAMVLIDSVSRLIDGVLASDESYLKESHYNGLLEFPQYTRPYEFRGKKVPEVLISGHHANIDKWRYLKMLERTRDKRPGMFNKYEKENKQKVLEAFGLLPKKKNRKKAGGVIDGKKGTSGV